MTRVNPKATTIATRDTCLNKCQCSDDQSISIKLITVTELRPCPA